jgi:hypothetical protein
MDGAQEPRHLPERPELEHRVVERRLALEQDAPELEHHAQPQRQRHGHGAHLAGDRGVGVDDHLGLPAAQPCHLLGAVESLARADARHVLGRGDQGQPDRLALKPPYQRHAAPLEQLSLGSGETASGSKGTGESGESGRR